MDASFEVQGVAPVTPFGQTPIPTPISAITYSDLAEMIAERGLEDCIDIAAHWHSVNSTPDPPTSQELLTRVKCVKPEHINDHHQDLPNALALRLLAPLPGRGYGFESLPLYVAPSVNPGSPL